MVDETCIKNLLCCTLTICYKSLRLDLWNHQALILCLTWDLIKNHNLTSTISSGPCPHIVLCTHCSPGGTSILKQPTPSTCVGHHRPKPCTILYGDIRAIQTGWCATVWVCTTIWYTSQFQHIFLHGSVMWKHPLLYYTGKETFKV